MLEQKNLQILLGSHFPIIVIETHEELRSVELLKSIVASQGKGFYTWTVAKGLKCLHKGEAVTRRFGNLQLYQSDTAQQQNTTDPEVMLSTVGENLQHCVVALLDFHPYLATPSITRHLKEIAQDFDKSGNVLVLISHALAIPDELKRFCASFDLSLPGMQKIRKMINDEAVIWRSRNNNALVKADPHAVELLTQNLVGLTESDAARLIKNAIYDDGAITQSDLAGIREAKYRLVGQDGVLSFEYDSASFADIGGFMQLKGWLAKRKEPFLAETTPGSDCPKGILLVGVQGGGKSLAAKAIAGAWQLPLLRFDLATLYNKFVGETERNIRDALKTADVMAPCILWIDEIEKGIASEGSDNGTSQRVLGTLLTWMAERRSRVFIVATANRIEQLPAELIRKGRLDEIFFVDLPGEAVRREIIEAHLRKRQLSLTPEAIAAVAEASGGYSGAELEQAIVAARYGAVADKRALQRDDLLQEIARTRPLSIVMADQVEALRSWARQRTVSVD